MVAMICTCQSSGEALELVFSGPETVLFEYQAHRGLCGE